MSSFLLLSRCTILVLVVSAVVVGALRPTVPRTEKRYLIHLHPLLEGLTDSDEKTLVSITEKTSLWLPRGSAKDGDEHLSFNTDMDPFWVHILRRRQFTSLEWSGCGGSWHPEWRTAPADAEFPINVSTVELIYELSHQTVCYFSSLSACGWSGGKTMRGNVASASVDPSAEAYRQHVWLAHFVSSLLPSALTWSMETPLHLRPIGTLRLVSEKTASEADEDQRQWCAFHLSHHDTVCTQNVNTILNGGRSGTGVGKDIPEGIFRAGLVTFKHFFSSEFHHFHFDVSQSPIVAEDANEETEIRLVIRMAFVVRKEDFGTLAAHWKRSLLSYADRLTFFSGSQLNEKLAAAVRYIESSQGVETEPRNGEALKEMQEAPGREQWPIAHHYISSVGHVFGTYRLVLFPSVMQTTPEDGHPEKDDWYGLKEGDTLDVLIMLPLHVIRPSLSEMRYGSGVMSRVENAFVDNSTNVLVVHVKTVLTKNPSRDPLWDKDTTDRGSLLICEFPFRWGWASLVDLPHDANSYRIFPHPVIRVGRRFETKRPNTTASIVANCATSKCAFTNSMQIDHQSSLERLLQSMMRGFPKEEMELSSCVCYYWIRCRNVAGTTIPVPDPAMLFNVISIGLLFFGLLTSGVVRISRRFFEVSNQDSDAEKVSS